MTAEHDQALISGLFASRAIGSTLAANLRRDPVQTAALLNAARAEGPQPTRVEGEDLEWLRGVREGCSREIAARIDRILAALSSPPPPSGGELARANLDRIHHALHRELDRLGAPRFADAFNPDCPAPMDVLSRLSALPQTRTGEGG